MFGFTILFVASGLVFANSENSVPQWSPVYTVRGMLYIPASDLQEPFQVWYDSSQNLSRIDYYDGMLRTYQYPPLIPGASWTLINVVPISTETQLNVMTCRQLSNELINIQPAFPDLVNYEYIGIDRLLETEAQKWQFVWKNYRNNTVQNSMWVVLKTDKYGKETVVPKKYEVIERDTEGGRVFDHIYIEYSDYKVGTSFIRENIFDYCTGVKMPCVVDDYVLSPLNDYIRNYPTQHEEAFAEFKAKHEKQYESDEEHEKRRIIFRDNLRFIESHNRAKRGFTLEVNHLADYTEEEMHLLRGRRGNPVEIEEGHQFPYSEDEIRQLSTRIPSQFDWRLYGAVTPVKNQLQCGSCWSFGTVGTVEGAAFLKTGKLVRFSEQALVDCSWGFGNSGCGGGQETQAYQWIMKHGLPTDEAYGGYLAKDGYCHIENVTTAMKIAGWVNVAPYNENALKVAIFNHGPVAVSINSDPKSFTFYENGVYYDPKCNSTLDHTVLAVGYGILHDGGDLRSYWLIKNSWGNRWGNDGYILISTDDNNCGVLTSPSYVEI